MVAALGKPDKAVTFGDLGDVKAVVLKASSKYQRMDIVFDLIQLRATYEEVDLVFASCCAQPD